MQYNAYLITGNDKTFLHIESPIQKMKKQKLNFINGFHNTHPYFHYIYINLIATITYVHNNLPNPPNKTTPLKHTESKNAESTAQLHTQLKH